MEYEDSRNALFVEPNAYVQTFSKQKNEIKKVVFSEPYERMPNFYLNNDFKKKDCACVEKEKHNCQPQKTNCNPFDFKNILPMLGGFLGKGFDISKIASIMNSNQSTDTNNNSMMTNIMNFLSTDMGKNILNIFTKNSTKNYKKNNKNSQKIKSSDFCVDNYERVE